MMTFDAASRDICTVKRQETNTPLQALVLLNDPQVIEASRALALNALSNNAQSVSEQIKYIFQRATSRLPTETELNSLSEYYNQMLSQVNEDEVKPEDYLMIGAFEVPETVNKEKLAALSLTSHTILNLDETISRG